MARINPVHNEREAFDSEVLAEGGITEELLTTPIDVGLVILASPQGTVGDYVEAGLTIVMVNDQPAADGGAPSHEPIAVGRITYAKAINLASALIHMCTGVIPLTQREDAIVERINAHIAQHIAEDEQRVDTETSGGRPFNVI